MSFLSLAEVKVGALVVAIGGLIAFMSMQVSDDPSFMGRSKKAWFLLPNANGLIKGSAIKSAGIPIGVIKDIKLQDGQARVDVTVTSDVGLTRSASVEMRANGILGDKHIDVNPGTIGDPALEDGGQIVNVKSGGSLDDVMGQVGEITNSLKDVAKNLKEAVSDDGTNKHILGRVMLNIEKLTGDLSQMTSENKEQIGEIVDQVNNITSTIDELVNDESDAGFKKTWKKTMARLDNSMKNIDDITTKINNGEGTIGKLISDEQTSEDVSSAIEGISGMVDTASKTSTGIDFNSYYINEVHDTKSAIGVTIQPGLDRYYYIGVITDPAGTVEQTTFESTVNGQTTKLEEKKTFFSKTKYTLIYGKNFFDWTLRAGIIESTGGFGVDYTFYRDKFKLSTDLYNFDKIQLRSYLSYKLFYGFYLTAGYNDIFNKQAANSPYFGAGLFLTNDDLKLLLSKASF
ncbi:MAG: MCE family protein [Bdellovibrionaceae bacterium]|nr:MCE family protein [Bdellovibrio sp.]